MQRIGPLLVLTIVLGLTGPGCHGPGRRHEKSVRPGINAKFKNPDIQKWVGRFESDDRELFVHRHKIVESLGVRPGMAIADVGAGTGFFSLLFSRQVGPEGTVFAVEISPGFLEHIRKLARDEGLSNIRTILCTDDSVELPEASIDIAFMCDTYHHLEYPNSVMKSIHHALKPGGRLIVIDFKRTPGVSRKWVIDHVRAGLDEVTAEILDTGFKLGQASPDVPFLDENYILTFTR